MMSEQSSIPDIGVSGSNKSVGMMSPGKIVMHFVFNFQSLI